MTGDVNFRCRDKFILYGRLFDIAKSEKERKRKKERDRDR